MKKIFPVFLYLSLLALTNSHAQVSGNFQYGTQQPLTEANRGPASNAIFSSNSEIILEVNGLMNIVASNYVAIFNIIQTAETTETTNQLMNTRVGAFKKELKKIGIDTTQIKVDILSFVPKYDFQTENKVFSKTYNEIPAGFELQKNVSVRYKNSSQLDEIVSAAASAEMYDLVKVDYFVPNLQKSLDSLRAVCIPALKAKAKTYDALGFKLDTLKKVMTDNFTTVYPPTRYFSYQAFSRPSLTAAKKNGKAYVNEAPKTTSKFYSQVDYNSYDLVINPIVTEPVVQLSYSLKVKYFLTEEKSKNTYYILTPSGETKQFNPK